MNPIPNLETMMNFRFFWPVLAIALLLPYALLAQSLIEMLRMEDDY